MWAICGVEALGGSDGQVWLSLEYKRAYLAFSGSNKFYYLYTYTYIYIYI